jgi:hypothetical protein
LVYSAGCASGVGFTFPVAEYTHNATGGCSITGGYVYRGTMYPNFIGKYFFADYCVNKVGMYGEGNPIAYSASLAGVGGITSFGEDLAGELYLASSSNGRIYKIIDTSLGTADFASNGLQVYPNPASGILNISAQQQVLTDVVVHDLSGKEVLRLAFGAGEPYKIDVSGIAAGLYGITVFDNTGKRFTTKWSKL